LVASDFFIGAHSARHTPTAISDLVAKRAKKDAEKGVVLHTATAATTLDKFSKKLVWVKRDGLVRRVVKLQVLKGDVAEMVACDGFEEWKAVLLRSSETRVPQHRGVKEFLW
jgi:hypothetical protein